MTPLNMIPVDMLCESIGWTLVHSLWQISLVAILYGVAKAVSRDPRWRYASACTALVIVLFVVATTSLMAWQHAEARAAIRVATGETQAAGHPPSHRMQHTLQREPAETLNSFVSHTSRDSTESAAATATDARLASPGEAKTDTHPLLIWLVIGWAVGVLVVGSRILIGSCFAVSLRRSGERIELFDLNARLDDLRGRLGVRCPVIVRQSARIRVPILIGYLKPMILIPLSATNGLTASQWHAILAHELAHVRRHDFIVNLLQTLLESIFFYHPALWWLSAEVRREREHCCDDLAVTACGDRTEYVRALLELEEQRSPAFSGVLAASGGRLVERVSRLLGKQPRRSRGGWGALSAIVGMIAVSLMLLASPLLTAQSSSATGSNTAPLELRPHQSQDRSNPEVVTSESQEVTETTSHNPADSSETQDEQGTEPKLIVLMTADPDNPDEVVYQINGRRSTIPEVVEALERLARTGDEQVQLQFDDSIRAQQVIDLVGRAVNLRLTRVTINKAEDPENDPESPARREWPFVVTGKITDEHGEPLPGVAVRAHCGMGSLRQTGAATTDEDGKYTMRIGPGMLTQVSEASPLGVGMQAATISPQLEGYVEQNLHQQGNLFMADAPKDEENVWGARVDQIILPDRPHELDFVMVKAVTMQGTLINERGWKVRDHSLFLTGEELPPSSSVLASVKTDRRGNFVIDGVPTGKQWRFGLRVTGTGQEILTEPFTFDTPGEHICHVVLHGDSREDGSVKLTLKYVPGEPD